MKLKYLFFLSVIICFTSCEDEYGHHTSNELDGLTIGLTTGQVNNGSFSISTNEIIENPFINVKDENTSTFSIDADGASYSTVRRYLEEGIEPNKNGIRTEELINYFNYDYSEPQGNHPISLEGEISVCPWNDSHKLIRVGIKGKSINLNEAPASNIVFLVDVSGSMRPDDRLPLVIKGLKKYVDQIRNEDMISIVTYSGGAGVILEPTSGAQKSKIKDALNNLEAGGGTNGEGGIIEAYKQAEKNLIDCGNNRVVVVSDGGFNVGVYDQELLIELIEEKRDLGVFLTIIGVGSYVNEGLLEQIANNGNGNYEYIDKEEQLNKVFIDEYSKFYTVAKDVKVQVAFNENLVKAYRLIGYENRILENEDFEDDSKDAGEIGANQSITAFYEIIPSDKSDKASPAFTVDFRYKDPKSSASEVLKLDIKDNNTIFENASENHRFASSVAAFGLVLRDSEYKGNATYKKIKVWAKDSKSFDPFGFKNKFIDLIDKADDL